jgi:hypothetical protein
MFFPNGFFWPWIVLVMTLSYLNVAATQLCPVRLDAYDVHFYAGDGVAAMGAPLWQPHGVCIIAEGSLIGSDTINDRVRVLLPEE